MLRDFTKIIIKNKTYSQLDKTIYSILHKLENLIPNDQLYLLETLENSYNLQECVIGDLSYIQGIRDTKKLNQ